MPRKRRTLKELRNELKKVEEIVTSIRLEIEDLIVKATKLHGASGGEVRPVAGGSCPPPK